MLQVHTYSVYRMIFDEFDMVPIYAVNKDRQILKNNNSKSYLFQ